jgi:transcription elongation GreA/GreB family factor
LRRDADCANGAASSESSVGHAQHGVAHGDTVEFDEPRKRARWWERFIGKADDGGVVAHHRRA